MQINPTLAKCYLLLWAKIMKSVLSNIFFILNVFPENPIIFGWISFQIKK